VGHFRPKFVTPRTYSPTVAEGLPSLGLVAAQVEKQLANQLDHFDGLDSKAGIVLGFAGVLVAVAGAFGPLQVAGKIVSVSAALLALWAFVPRKYPVLNTARFRDRYLRSDPSFTQLHLLDTQIMMEEQAARLLARKALRLKLSVMLLALSIVLLAAGMLFHTGGSP
jgi:hypothetical protein